MIDRVISITEPPLYFIDINAAKFWLSNYSSEVKRKFLVKHSNCKLYEVKCKISNCHFIYKYRWSKKEDKYLRKEFVDHSCSESHEVFKSIQVIEESKQILSDVREITATDLGNHLLSTRGKYLTYRQSFYLINIFKKRIREEERKSYGLIKPWLEKNKELNPDSHFIYSEKIIDDVSKFEFLFYAPPQCKHAMDYTLPLITIDACHTKGEYKGMIYTATAVTGAGTCYYLALGIAPTENYEYWKKFISGLNEAFSLANMNNLVVLSDREKGISRALNEIMPFAYHSLCVFHIEKNIKNRFGFDTSGLIWKAAKVARESEFNESLIKLQELKGEAVVQYIRSIDPELWSTAFFPVPRFGHVTSNLSESCNSTLKTIRLQAPFRILTDFISLQESNIVKNRRKYENFPINSLVDNIANKINILKSNARSLKITERANMNFLEIQSARHSNFNHIYNKLLNLCTCNLKSEFGYPCLHMYAVIARYNIQESDFISSKLKKITLQNLYNLSCPIPVNVLSLVRNDTCEAIERIRRGRPRLNERRIPSVAESINRRIVTCRRCGNSGHNSRTCPERN